MRIDEKTRLDLRRAFEDLIGPELAAALMEAIPNIEYDDLATKAYVDRTRIELRGEMAELRADLRTEMAELRAELRAEMAELRTELGGEMGQLRGEMGLMHGALERRMAANLRATLASHVGSIVAVAGLFAGFS